MTEHIKRYIQKQYPNLIELTEECSSVEAIIPSEFNTITAVTKIIVGQMLSRKAAETIYSRVQSGLDKSKKDLHEITISELREAGVSQRKAQAITNFFKLYKTDPAKFNNWQHLDYQELYEQVSTIWGISSWTASMLAIFHYANEDVFPYSDGTIKRALERLQHRGINIDPSLAKPYRSYLALYLWKFIDEQII
ncbi:hypothetical protein V1358_15525 [Pseudoalteromonas sp. YIC-656]|uniref:DNA-3-methyladenine glycosylase family protein n=1 Tax=Pseudoalteromonas pernae TaxID=3118054 RepID=UPI003241E3C3